MNDATWDLWEISDADECEECDSDGEIRDCPECGASLCVDCSDHECDSD